MDKDFKTWRSTFKKTINTYEHFVDFDKVYEDVEKLKVELSILNTLVGSREIEKEFKQLVNRYPEVLKCIPFLLALRGEIVECHTDEGEIEFNFTEQKNSIDEYVQFMSKTGLFDLIENHIVRDLIDYATGVSVGLNSNARKNRTGHQMEDIVERYITEADPIEYRKEMTDREIEEEWGIDLSPISDNHRVVKRFDFVVKTESVVWGIETNFYNTMGSKLNETARSYKMIAQEAKDIDGFNFVWVTDGQGWKRAEGNLQETFDESDNIYNLNDLEKGAFNKLFNE